MKSNKAGCLFRKYARIVHKDLSYFLAGMILIYAISGIAMNHRDTFNPDYSISIKSFVYEDNIPSKDNMKKEDVIKILESVDKKSRYTKHYFPQQNLMKVFLKGGSNLIVNIKNKQITYEKLSRRPLLSTFTRMHYNPGKCWTYFSDFFAIGLFVITLTGILMTKLRKGLFGRGGVEFVLGIIIPLIIFFF